MRTCCFNPRPALRARLGIGPGDEKERERCSNPALQASCGIRRSLQEPGRGFPQRSWSDQGGGEVSQAFAYSLTAFGGSWRSEPNAHGGLASVRRNPGVPSRGCMQPLALAVLCRQAQRPLRRELDGPNFLSRRFMRDLVKESSLRTGLGAKP